MNMEKPTNKKTSFQRFDGLQLGYQSTNNQAISCFLKENVRIVTINTIWLRVLIDPFVSRLYSYDQKTHLSIRIHIVENEEG